jgi:hypothetical protein
MLRWRAIARSRRRRPEAGARVAAEEILTA